MEIKTEADSNDIAEYSHGRIQSTDMFILIMIHLFTLICYIRHV